MNRFSVFSVAVAILGVANCHAVSAHGSRERVVYSFQNNGTDAQNPAAALLAANGTLYGTAENGGTDGAGAVFSIVPKTGQEAVVYSFENNGVDGNYPVTPVLNAKGTFYGSTQVGGAYNGGVIYSLDAATGAEKVLFSFCSEKNCTDGDVPAGELVKLNGLLYGVTAEGGQNNGCLENGCGTIFSVNHSTGAETVLYNFCSESNCTDGYLPTGGLLNIDGTLYGTTQGGGTGGAGTLFSVDPTTGTEMVVHSFAPTQGDGSGPNGRLINVNGTIYGTTDNGGRNGGGTVFAFDTNTGVESVLYSFCSRKTCKNGFQPMGGVIDVNGTLYGTTYWGGNPGCYDGSYGCGTVFSLNLETGVETVLYKFCKQSGCTDGASPSGLIYDGTRLYGTTEQGGTGMCNQYAVGCGTVFSLKP